MEIVKIYSRVILLIVVAISLGFAGKCSKSVDMRVAPGFPAATGKVKISKSKNGNTVAELTVKNLGPPERLTPPRQYYVVWVQPPGQYPENRGQLSLNKNLSGKKSVTTPHRDFDLFITAENTITGVAPTGREVMRASPRR